MKFLVWGCGNMARAFTIGWSHAHQGDSFACWNPSQIKAQNLAQKISGRWLSDPQNVGPVDVVILGFKPQKLNLAAPELLKQLRPGTLVISLLAAVSLDQLAGHFPQMKLIRLMPNLPVEHNQGVVLWEARGLSEAEIPFWGSKLEKLGLASHVNEAMIDLYTLHAGCSPAFLYSWIDSASQYAHKNGGDAELAKQILIKSWKGALDGLENDLTPLQEKINAVASQGGVTRAALNGFADYAPDYIERGFEAGLKRLLEIKANP